MKNFKTLLGVLFRVNFSSRKILGSSYTRSKGKTIAIAFAILYAIVAYVGAFGYLFFDLGKTLAESGLTEVLLMYVFLYAAGAGVMIVFFRSESFLFRFKDFEILAPLPIKPRAIIAAKSIVMMTNVYIIAFLASVPILFSYFFHTAVPVAGILMVIPAFLAIPLLPAVAAALLSYGIRLITDRLPKSRIFNIVLMFSAFIALMVAQFSFAGSGDQNPLLNQQGFIAGLGEIFLPMKWFAAAVHEGSFLDFLFLVASGVALFVTFVLILSKAILKTNSRARNERYSKTRKTVRYQSGSAFKAVLAKEWRTFVGLPMYILNSGFGPVLMLVVAIASLFFADKVEAYLGQIVAAGIPSVLLILIIVCFCVGMVYTSAVSLSIEGKRFWIVRSLPIAATTVMDAKLVFNILLGTVPALVAIPLFGIAFAFPVLDVFVMIILVVAFSILTSTIGSLINLRFPKFDFINEIEVVKQSLGAMISIFSTFGLMALEGFALTAMMNVMVWQYGVLLLAVVDLAIAFGLHLVIVRFAESLFIKMKA